MLGRLKLLAVYRIGSLGLPGEELHDERPVLLLVGNLFIVLL